MKTGCMLHGQNKCPQYETIMKSNCIKCECYIVKKKVNDIYKNKKNGTLYVLTKIVNAENVYTNLEDKYTYTIPDDHMELWYESI